MQARTQKESKGTRGHGGKKGRGWGRARLHYPQLLYLGAGLPTSAHWHLGHNNLCYRRSGEQYVWHRIVSNISGLYPLDAASCDKNVSRHHQIYPEGHVTLGKELLPWRMATTRIIWGWAQHILGDLPYMFMLLSTIQFMPLICPPQNHHPLHILRQDSSFRHC